MLTSTVAITRDAHSLRLQWLNNIEVTFTLEGETQSSRVLGIRDVIIQGVPLRNPAKLWRPVIATPEGVHYAAFILKEVVEEEDGTVRVVTDAIGIHTCIQEEQDEYLCDVLTLPSSDVPLVDRFEWVLAPSSLALEERAFAGFSFRYHFTSADGRKIYRIFDDATWEIGGQVEGNTLLLQGQVNPPVTALRREDYYTTACNYYGAEMRGVMGKPERISMQRLPRIGTLQAFDFLAHARGILFNLYDPVMEVFTIVQKEAGEDLLHIMDELRRPLASDFETHPKHILFTPLKKALPLDEVKNIWTRAHDFVHERERSRAGIAPSPVMPRVWIPQFSKDKVKLDGEWIPRLDTMDYMADRILPRWAEMGVKEICMHSIWTSDYTLDRFKYKQQTGMHGGLYVGSICCVRDRVIDPIWGGEAGVARFTARAHELGMAVQLWWATHLSRRAPIYAERPDFMMLARDGHANGGGYGHLSIITMNLANPDCLEWEFQKLKAVYESTGVDGFFHDSYGNMTFLPMAYNDPQRTGQQLAFEELLRRLQAIGLKTMTIEGMGPFGVGHFGMNLLPKKADKAHGYQNALDWWLGHEDMLIGLNMGIGQRVWPGQAKKTREFAFRAIAAGGRFGFTQHEKPFEMWSGWLKELNRLHARIAPVTGHRTLLPKDRGILWEQDGRQLLFTFRAFPYAVPNGMQVSRITPDGEMPMPVNDSVLHAHAWTVYQLR